MRPSFRINGTRGKPGGVHGERTRRAAHRASTVHSESLGSPGVFRGGAEYGTRGACAPHARRPAFPASFAVFLFLKEGMRGTRRDVFVFLCETLIFLSAPCGKNPTPWHPTR